jgi:uncharacterized protein involved in type VI secretion and phage assembly
MQPEAGGPSNRGYSFVPEVNDKVLVSFFEGNPEFPFIMGSMFHAGNGKGIGGGAGNHIKSMRDKSGSEVVLNEKDGSVTIKDKVGDFVKLDGSKNITVEAGKTTTINVGENQSVLKMDKDGNISITGTTKITLEVKGNTIVIDQQGITATNKDGNSTSITPDGITNTAKIGKIDTVAETGSILITSDSSDISLSAATKIDVTAGESVNLSATEVNSN